MEDLSAFLAAIEKAVSEDPPYLVSVVGGFPPCRDLDLLVIGSEPYEKRDERRFCRILDAIETAIAGMDIQDSKVASLYSSFHWSEPFLLSSAARHRNLKMDAFRIIHLIAYIDYPAFLAAEHPCVIQDFWLKVLHRQTLSTKNKDALQEAFDVKVGTSKLDFLWARWSQATVVLRLNMLPKNIRERCVRHYVEYLANQSFPLDERLMRIAFERKQ